MEMLTFNLIKRRGVLAQEIDASSETVALEVTGVDDEFTIIVTHPDKRQYYRNSVEHRVEIPVPKTDGVMDVTLHYKDEYLPCSPVNVQRRDGKIYLSYSQQELYDKYVDLLKEMEGYAGQVAELTATIKELNEKIERLTEGYDID